MKSENQLPFHDFMRSQPVGVIYFYGKFFFTAIYEAVLRVSNFQLKTPN